MKAQLFATAALASLALSGPAADRTTNQPNRYPTNHQARSASHLEKLGTVVKASDIIGLEVKNRSDEKVGKVDDLAVDLETGRILEVFVSAGGVLGIGDKVVSVPPGSFTCEAPHPTLRLDTTKEQLKAAPAVELSQWDRNVQTNRLHESYRAFGRTPYFAGSDPALNRAGRTPDPAYQVPVRLERASKLIGASVRTTSDEKLGKIDNLMVDVTAGRIVHVILSSGGFLGVGDDLRAMPPSIFRVSDTDSTLTVNVTKDTVVGAPRYDSTRWPNFSDSRDSALYYRAYRVEPYFSADADNTSRNVRDRNEQTLTPLDQGTSDADVTLTRNIRKGILDQQNLSSNARNVKVITVNGRVTLRGPVNSDAEKRSIEEVIQRVAPGSQIDNQLEVKQPENR